MKNNKKIITATLAAMLSLAPILSISQQVHADPIPSDQIVDVNQVDTNRLAILNVQDAENSYLWGFRLMYHGKRIHVSKQPKFKTFTITDETNATTSDPSAEMADGRYDTVCTGSLSGIKKYKKARTATVINYHDDILGKVRIPAKKTRINFNLHFNFYIEKAHFTQTNFGLYKK